MVTTVEQMAAHWKRRQEKRRADSEARAALLLQKLPEAARVLRECHGARRIVLFGSLACGTPHEESDVDLAVEGLRPGSFFRAMSDLWSLFGGPVDLVEVEEAPSSLVDRLRVEGREL